MTFPRRRDRRSKTSNTGIYMVVGLLAVPLLLIFAIIQQSISANRTAQPIEGVQSISGLQPSHVEGLVTYGQNPPAGGPHNPAWQNCGVYTEVIANENAVHSQEHGAVWITYSPDLSSEDVDQLQRLTRGSGYRLLSPYEGLPSPIVASAWGNQLFLDQADDPRLALFIEKYELGPDAPEAGAPCFNGVGDPQ